MSKFTLQEIFGAIKKYGYTHTKIYSQESIVKFIQLQSTLQRKPFLLQFPARYSLSITNTDHLLTEVEKNYKSFRQEEYLKKIITKNVACLSGVNLIVKNDSVITCYLLDSVIKDHDDISDIDADSGSESDIIIDDYPVENIFPVFDVHAFTTGIVDFEDQVIKSYSVTYAAEEEMNEEEVTQLLKVFEKQRNSIRERVFNIHKDSYNIRRDISETGEQLSKLYGLKKKSVGEKDRTLFKLDRLIMKTELQLDSLNKQLYEKRDEADLLLKKYRKYIEQFDL